MHKLSSKIVISDWIKLFKRKFRNNKPLQVFVFDHSEGFVDNQQNNQTMTKN